MIIIILLITSVAVPAYSHLHASSQFHEGVAAFASHLNLARDLAVRDGVDVRIRYEAQSGNIHITTDVPEPTDDVPQELADQEADTDSHIPERVFDLPSGMGVALFQVPETDNTPNPLSNDSNSNQDQVLVFHEDGSSTGAHIQLVSDDGHTQLIEIVPLTGQVLMEDQDASGTGA